MKPVRAVVFDTDGVLLDSAVLHAAAWKTAFDGCQETWACGGERQRPFDADQEYRELVDGKSRYDGARAFLTARGMDLPSGTPADEPGCATVWAVAARKERAFTEILRTRGAQPFADVEPALGALASAGVRCAAVSASRHARSLLEAAGLLGLFELVVDGTDAARLALPGKPDPAVFLEAARGLGAEPARTAVVEDALAGVDAGRRGHFGLVVGIDRTGKPGGGPALLEHGADVVAADLSTLPGLMSRARP
ncbi:HAD-IA family hydrolase [Streptomyces sp. NPDC050448]|uniref:HAD family hydrolase n=1 Tax=Streptomyces sp. NPDC050448 TaxID=3155404 RepID=UPI0034291AD4